MNLAAGTLLTCWLLFGSEIKTDEQVVFYPTFGRFDADRDVWTLDVHGSVFEPEEGSLRRGLLVSTVRRSLEVEEGTPEAAILERRLRRFLVDNEEGKTVSIRLGARVYRMRTSAENGHFDGWVRLSADDALQLRARSRLKSGWLDFSAVLPAEDRRRFAGRVQLVGPRGLSVISDLDDTIKHTEVTDRRAMLRNTFLREFEAVPGMARQYAKAAANGVVFHYVSGSPWQLYEPLAAMLRREGFPAGSFHLKHFRLSDSSGFEALFGSQQDHKQRAIGRILTAFPERRFVLIGDSGEQDPEIYGRLAREHPEQIAAVMIRNVTDASLDDERFRAAAKDVERFLLFRDAEEIGPVLDKLIAEHAAR